MKKIALMAMVGATLAGCGNQSAPQQDSQACTPTVAGADAKVQVESAWNGDEAGTASDGTDAPVRSRTIKAGTELTAVIKDECAGGGRISSSIKDLAQGKTPSGVRSYKWSIPSDLTEDEIKKWAQEDPCVSLVSDLYNDSPSEDLPLVLPDDPSASKQAHLSAIGASKAYDIFYAANKGVAEDVVIAIIDSGVELTHEDLAPHLWKNTKEVPGNKIDDDKNGYVDDVYGYNFASNIPSPMYQKSSANSAWQYAHGTRVAGLAAAVADNGKGVTGVMGTAKIMSLNVMGTASNMPQVNTSNAIRYAVDNGAHVINLSLGGSPAGADFQSALRYAVSKGVVVVAAAGNENGRIGTSYSAAGLASSLNGLMSIGNIQAATLAKSPSSNYSTTYVEIGAPGTNTPSSGLLSTGPNNGYGYFSGTSAATPVAAGAAALAIGLIKARGHAYTAGTIENLMLSSGKVVSSLTGYFKGGKALDLHALAMLTDASYSAGGQPVPLPQAGGSNGETGGGSGGGSGGVGSGGETSSGVSPGPTGVCGT